jgi:hypothetical protein
MDGYAAAGGPLPGDGAVPGFGSRTFPGDDFDLDGQFDWLAGEIEAGRLRVPEAPLEGPAVSLSPGEACDVDSVLLAAMCGPQGLGWPQSLGKPTAGPAFGQDQAVGAAFGQDPLGQDHAAFGQDQAVDAAFGKDQAADVLPPGPVLAALTAQAVSRPAALTDDELIGALQAARRLANLAGYQQTVAIAEFARRRQAEFDAARTAGKPAGCRDGEFPGEELAMELLETGPCTSARIDTALELTARLPCTLAGMAEGAVDPGRAMTIAARTASMTDDDAARADEVLAAAAPGLRPDQLARKAAALEMKLAPEAVRARKELARQLDQRVEARREASGNASLAGRELGTADVIAAKAHIDAIAVQLRDSGLFDATLDQLRVLALTDLTQGRDPLDRIKPAPGQAHSQPAPGQPDAPGSVNPDNRPGQDLAAAKNSDVDLGGGHGDKRRWGGPGRPSDPAPLPALINLLVPVGTLLGWGTAPAQAAGWGLLDADETRALIQAAAGHPRTRWCMTITAPDGTALAHGCAKGQRPWPSGDCPSGDCPSDAPAPTEAPPDAAPLETPPGPAPPETSTGPRKPQRPPRTPRTRRSARPPGRSAGLRQAAQLLKMLHRLNITLEPIARDGCDHRHAENRYVLSRKLRHLIRARQQTCAAPACNAQAIHCDYDHTIPYPDGPSCECNVNPKCRRHHRTKQAPGWQATQPTPGTTTWTTPSGRKHATAPTVYDL